VIVFGVSVCATVAHAQTLVAGRVYDVTEGQIAVAISTEMVTFEVTDATVITLNDRPATIAELRPGDWAAVVISRGPERFGTAHRISASRAPSAAPHKSEEPTPDR
jgi:hypothetical protein